MSKTIMLIHGAWLNAHGWETWKPYYEAKGFTVVAPSWPYDDRAPADLRASPDPKLGSLGHKQTIDHYDALVRALPEKPYLIGHSFGGVLVQHLLNRGLGAAGVAIDPAPTPGVALGPHAIVSALPVLGDLFSDGKVKHMTKEFFKTRFAQTLPEAMKDDHYERYIVPTPAKMYWDGVLRPIAINWTNPARPPLLLIAGGKDLIADASMTRAIFNKQKAAPSPTDYFEYPARSHWTCAEPGWEAVADKALEFCQRYAT